MNNQTEQSSSTTGLDLVDYIVKKLDDEDIRAYDNNIILYLRSMGCDELIKVLINEQGII